MEEGVSVDSGEEDTEVLLTLAEDEGLVGSDESLDTEKELEDELLFMEPLSNFDEEDEEDEEEAELLESLEDLVEIRLAVDEISELRFSLVPLEDILDEEELWWPGLVYPMSSPTSSTVTKSSMLKLSSSKK